jgi:transposase
MKIILKQVVGIDVAKSELVVCLGRMSEDLMIELFANKNFENSKKGFEKLLAWVSKLSDKDVSISYVMEATGVYHESFAYFLADMNQKVCIVLPNKICNYVRTLEVKTENDKTASQAIARFGLERKLEFWTKPDGLFMQIKQLTRERGQIVEQQSIIKNQIHAEKHEAIPNLGSLKRMKARLVLMEKQVIDIQTELQELVKKRSDLKTSIDLLCTIPGIGFLTAATVLGETNAFDLIENRRQITSYAGLDVKQKESGSSIHRKTKISKRGNKHLRKALHMPSLSSIKHSENYKEIYVRLVSRNGIKMQALVAIQRRLLEMMYTIYKNKKPYDLNYYKNQKMEMVLDQKMA